METLDVQRKALIERIEAAFPDPGYPAELRPCSCSRPSCSDCEALDAIFRGRRWHEILPVPMFPDLCDAPALLDDDAFKYFLPAFLIGCLKDSDAADVTADHVAYAFLDRPIRQGLVETLAPSQRGTLYDYLDWWAALDWESSKWKAKLDHLTEQIPRDLEFQPEPLPMPDK